MSAKRTYKKKEKTNRKVAKINSNISITTINTNINGVFPIKGIDHQLIWGGGEQGSLYVVYEKNHIKYYKYIGEKQKSKKICIMLMETKRNRREQIEKECHSSNWTFQNKRLGIICEFAKWARAVYFDVWKKTKQNTFQQFKQ